MARSFQNMRLSLLVPPLLLGCTLYYYNITRTSRFTIHYEDENVRDLESSFNARTRLNSKGCRMYGETHSVRVHVRVRDSGKMDAGDVTVPRGEVMLSKFLHGFFGGWAFAPEGVVLRRLYEGRDMDETISQRHAITLGEAKRRNTQLPPLLNAPSPSAPLPQIHQLYFGAFEVFAVDVIESEDGQTTNSIDIAFKTSDCFAGCHRLAVTQSQGGEMDTLSITTAVCNPEENRRPVQMGRGFYAFHVWYKDQLFRDAVSAVLRG